MKKALSIWKKPFPVIFNAKELYDEYEEILSQAEKVQGSDQSERRAWIRNKKQEVLKKSSSLAYELNERPQL